MPRAKRGTTAKTVSAIFERFVKSLNTLIKTHVAAAVNKATTDFLASKLGSDAAAGSMPPAPRKLRRRRRVSKKLAAPRPGYSKYGKKLGRPAKKKA